MTSTVGVGIVGAGPVVQAIHLPTLARLTDRFNIAAVMDVDARVAAEVAKRASAPAFTSLDTLLAAPEVDVVAICSPPQFHAEQVIAALRAGKRAVFCEKPLATTIEEAEEIFAAAAETGVPLVVGAMHTFDPGWIGAVEEAGQAVRQSHTIRSSIVLPMNERFEDWATNILERPAPPEPTDMDLPARAELMKMAVLGLAIHDLPLVRYLLSDFDELQVTDARLLAPFGYAITLDTGDRTAEIIGLMQPHWQPQWELQAFGNEAIVEVDFTPSFVHAGSAGARVRTAGRSVIVPSADHNGYEGEWRAIADILDGDDTLRPDLGDLVADLRFAVHIADAARGAVLRNGSSSKGSN